MTTRTSTPKNGARNGVTRLVPVMIEAPADLLTPVSLYLRLRGAGRRSFLLEGVEGGERSYRYSYVGVDPSETFSIREGVLRSERDGVVTALPGNPLLELGVRLSSLIAAREPGLPPFSGGAVGFLGYECFRYLEAIPAPQARPLDDDARVMVFRTVVALDAVRHRLLLITHFDAAEGEVKGRRAALRVLEKIRTEIAESATKGESFHSLPGVGPLAPERLGSSLGEEQFLEGVRKIKSHIRAGDIFQCVLSEQFRLELSTPAFDVYRALRRVSPAPYQFYLDFGDEQLLGASPEMLTRVSGRTVETCPIAGTRPRGVNEAEDRRYEQQLLGSPKERAEHLMLVDLGRNDLGRIAAPGSVRVAELMRVERFSHVMHLVSLVKGTLGGRRTAWEALLSCFPAGTLTGAPKIRASHIIAGLERTQRGPYGGAVLTYGFNGDLDSCITIRSMHVKKGVGLLQAGAGVVADSSPAREYEEVMNKTRALRQALAEARA